MVRAVKKFLQHPLPALKVAGAVVVLLVILSLGFRFIRQTLDSFGLGERFGAAGVSTMGRNMAYDADMYEESAQKGTAALSIPSPIPPRDGGFSSGDDAEDFAVTDYTAEIRTRDKEMICEEVSAWRALEYVIFEQASEHDAGCSFSFKVPHERAGEILEKIEEFDPDHLSTHTYTIKQSVEYATNETEILEQKLASINQTLDDAFAAYDEITEIATGSQDAESLATIIDSKIRLIERLTQERLQVHEQLRRMEQEKNRQLERLEYAYFHVSVQEDKYIDAEQIKHSWKQAIQSSLRDGNDILQGVTVGVVLLLFYVLQYALYFFILLHIVKYGWKYTKKIWYRP